MGTNYTGEESSSGIIPKVMENVFNKVEALKANTEFLIRVSFIEVSDDLQRVISFFLSVLNMIWLFSGIDLLK